MSTPQEAQGAQEAQDQGAVAEEPARGVVVGYDGSTSACTALAWAAGEAARRGSVLTVLYATDWYSTAAALAVSGSLAQDDPDALARRVVDEGTARVHEALTPSDASVPGVEVRVAPRLTDATTALVEASQTADLLVVGNRGRGALAGALLGSVAFSVTAAAHCPVVVVRGESASGVAPGPGRPVVVGVDGSPGADRAVTFAAQVAARTDAPLRVVAAWTTPEVFDAGFAVLAYQEVTDAALETAQDAARAGAQSARAAVPHLVVEEAVVHQPARQALAEASAGAGLVVVGARGHGTVTGLFLGSVSHAVIHHATCPVAVVHANQEADSPEPA